MESIDYDETEYEGLEGLSVEDDTLVNISLYPSTAQDATTTTNVTIPMTSFAQLLTMQTAVRETGHVVIGEQHSQSSSSTTTKTCSPDYGSLTPSPPPPIDPTTTNNTYDDYDDPSNIPLTSTSICAILSTAYAYGCIMTTLFLLTLPLVCERIETETTQYTYYTYTISKSMALGGFAAIAGLTQLATPLVGMLSDECGVMPSTVKYGGMRAMGKRMPYLVLGTVLAVSGFVGQMVGSASIHPFVLVSEEEGGGGGSTTGGGLTNGDNGASTIVYGGAWITYTLFFAVQNIGLNMVYTVMMALIPDLIPPAQTGVANGSLAMMVVTGSLFGFGMFHTVGGNLMSMYLVYISVSFVCGVITYVFVLDREMLVRSERRKRKRRLLCETTTTTTKEEEGMLLPSSSLEDAAVVGTATNEAMSSSEVRVAMGEVVPDNAKGGGDGGYWNCLWSIPYTTARTLYAILYEPISTKSYAEIASAYWIDTHKYRDFYIVTISRFFYYMGISSQTFFLYFIHDELQENVSTSSSSNPESVVALLAIVGQTAGAITCYPVGILSDQYFGSRRKPFVYMACVMLAVGNLSLLLCTTLSQMILVSIWLGAANGIYLTMDTSLAVDTIDEVNDEYIEVSSSTTATTTTTDTNQDKSDTLLLRSYSFTCSNVPHKNEAQMFGFWGVFGFLGSSIGPLTGGFALLFFGNMEPNSGSVTVNGDDLAKFYGMAGYRALFSLCALYFLCSALSLTLVRKKSV